MPLSCIIITSDTSLGRIDFESLTDQTRMELLIEGLGEAFKSTYKDKHGDYLDVCEWEDVKCDEDRRVTHFRATSEKYAGSLILDVVPPMMQEISLMHENSSSDSANAARGTLETSNLPQSLKKILIGRQAFHGTVDMTKLPESLTGLHIEGNDFSGSLDLTALPANMTQIDVSENQLSGSISLDHLPSKIFEIMLLKNNFSGTLCFDRLPESLEILTIEHNNFCGEFQLGGRLTGIELFAAFNAFEGTAVVPACEEICVSLRGNKVSVVVDEKGNPHKNAEDILTYALFD